jgi:phosphatidylglycerophosphate synthase
MVEASAALEGRQAKLWGAADALAAAFVLVTDPWWRFVILAVAAGSDLLDGRIARRYGASRLGVFLDPVADKLFMAAAFWVVLASRRLEAYEVVGVLLRDIVAAIAFVVTLRRGHPSSIPARAGGKAVTLAQNLTLLAFVTGSDVLRPMAWATAGIAMYAIWDYIQARNARRPVGS